MAQIVDRGNDGIMELIASHTEPHPARPGFGQWRMKEHGVPIWAVIGALILDDAVPVELAILDDEHLLAMLTDERTLARVAREYDLSPESVAAAVTYYQQYKRFIDARLLLNAA